jgi:hypothetical protein
MYMIGISSHVYGMTTQVVANTSEIGVQFIGERGMNNWTAVFCAKYEMHIVFYKSLRH